MSTLFRTKSVADIDATLREGTGGLSRTLTNIGTLFAFLVVCLGVLALRLKEPDRPRPFRVPAVWIVAPLGALSCLYVMTGLPVAAWERFGIWMALGLIGYFAYGYKHSALRRGAGSQ